MSITVANVMGVVKNSGTVINFGRITQDKSFNDAKAELIKRVREGYPIITDLGLVQTKELAAIWLDPIHTGV